MFSRHRAQRMTPLFRKPLSTWLLIACGVWLVGLGVFFVVLRPPLLPEDARFMDADLDALRAAAPGLERWLDKGFTVMGGFMAGAGVLTVVVAIDGDARGSRTTAVAIAGALTVATMSLTNFSLHSDFRWVLVVPVVAWIAGVVLRAKGR